MQEVARVKYKGSEMARKTVGQNLHTARALLAEVKNADAGERTAMINDGGGLILRKRGERWLWYFRTTSPETKRDTWISLAPRTPFPHTTLAAARELATPYRVSTDSGIDPKEERKRVAVVKARHDAA